MTNLNNKHFPWKIYAKLISSPSYNAHLIHDTEACLEADGSVHFKNLGVSIAMSSFKLEYYFRIPFGLNR